MASSSNKSVATDTMPDFAGKVLDAGRLRLLDCLGTGAYGKVYSAIDTNTLRDGPAFYAIKCLRVPKPGTPEEKLQLREFTNHLVVSSHPNVVTFHQLLRDDTDGEFRYVVLDLCAGGDLFEAIVERGFFVQRTDRVKTLFLQLVEAISFCHQNNVYHRDIKPENVLCSRDGSKVYIADFGLSTQAPMSRDFRCGSIEYMSPDCISKDFDFRGKSYSTRSNDIWALGVVFINMVTQRTPWNYARPKDPCFAAYLDDEDYFLRVLAISEGVNRILKLVFRIDPLRRISLSDLRREVVALEDCFPPADDDFGYISPILPASNSPRNSAALRRSSSSSVLSFDIGPIRIDDGVPQSASDSLLSVPAAVRSLTSIASSEGPITPETFPVNVDTEVPDIEEAGEDDLASDELLSELQSAKQSEFVKQDKPMANRKPFFRRFIHKKKARSILL